MSHARADSRHDTPDLAIALVLCALVVCVVVLPQVGPAPEPRAPTATHASASLPAPERWWEYPESIVVTDVGGNPFRIRVDKGHRLPAEFVPADLVTLTPDVIRTDKSVRVARALVEPLRALADHARRDGIDLWVVSGYRSYHYQQRLYNGYVRSHGGDLDATDRYSARPGHSEHQLGTVVDFSSAEVGGRLGERFNRSRASKWLLANAPDFGFRLSYPRGKERETRYMHEGWHWRFFLRDAIAARAAQRAAPAADLP